MHSVEPDFPAFLARVRAGEPDAVERFIADFGPWVLQTIRKRLNHYMRSQFDSVDFLQGVWASVFRRPECLGTVSSPAAALRILRRIAHNQVLDVARRSLFALKRDARRESSTDTVNQVAQILPQLPDHRTPSPSEICRAREQWERLLAAQPQHLRQIPLLRCLGATTEEIAAKLGLHERTVRKVIEKLEDAAKRTR
ncbi:MAG: ECF-type sigma factor [Pirellulales bacterium]